MKAIKLFGKKMFYPLMVVIFACISCTVDEDRFPMDEGNNLKDAVYFKNVAEFNEELNLLSQLNKEELEIWIKKNNPNSLYNTSIDNEYLNNLPSEYIAILNDKSEFLISDKILWLNEGELYEFNLADNRSQLKQDIKSLTSIGQVKLEFSEKDELNTPVVENADLPQARTIIYQNSLEGRHQREFRAHVYKNCSNQTKNINAQLKYVHELMTVETILYRTAHSKLYLRVKLEWLGGGWNPAGEPRNIDVNINLSGTYIQFHNGLTIPDHGYNQVGRTYTCSGNQTILLKTSGYYDPQFGSPYWSVQVTGTIDHELHGGYYPWKNYSNW